MRPKKGTIDEKIPAEDEVRKAVGKKIFTLRKQFGLSASRVAQELSISREAVTHIETGRNNISAVFLWKLAVIFNCSPADFFPNIPDGYALTTSDIAKIESEDEKAVEWAKKLFKKKQ